MTQGDLFPTATSSQPDTPASPSVSQGSKKAQKMTATSGRTSLELLHKKDPLGAFSKMFMVTLPWASTKCLLTWKPKATPQGRLLFQLAVSMPPTEETDSGLLHTPTAKANQMAPSMNSGWWATPRTTDATGGARQLDERGRRISKSSNLVFGANLADQVRMWPTPQARDWKSGQAERYTDKMRSNDLNDAVKMWPTPNASDRFHANMKDGHDIKKGYLRGVVKMWPTSAATNYKGSVKDRYMGSETYRANLDEAVRTHREDGQLNPDWVEWLMGYPPGWTSLQTPQEQSKVSGEEQTDLKD